MNTIPRRHLLLPLTFALFVGSCATGRATVDSGEELHVPGGSRERCVSWITQSPPSTLRWFVLLDELEAEPPDVRAQTVERIAFGLESWPDAERRVPSHWLPDEFGAQERATESTLLRHLDMRFLDKKVWRAWDFSGAPSGLTRVTVTTRAQARALIARVESDPTSFPALTALRLAGSSPHPSILSRLAGSALATRLESFEVGGPVEETSIASLLAQPENFPKLRALALRGIHLQGPRKEKMRAFGVMLAASPVVARLSDLELFYVPLGDEGVAALAAKGTWSHLERLVLQRSELGPEGAAALAKARFPKLRELDVSVNRLGNEGVKALSRPRAMGGLRRLSLGSVGMGDEGAKWVGSAAAWARVERLDLSRNAMTGDGLWQALGRGTFAALTDLDVSNNPLGTKALWSVVGSPHFSRLEHLDAAHVRATDLALAALAEAPADASLRGLDLTGNGLTSRSALALAGAPFIRGLTSLDLDSNPIGDEGAVALATAPAFFSVLRLRDAAIGDVGLAALMSADALRLVEVLDVSRNVWSDEGAGALGRARVMERLTVLLIEDSSLGTPENLVQMIWSPSVLHLARLDMDWDRVAVEIDDDVDPDEDPAALAFALADLPALGDRAINSPYMSAPLRRRISAFLGEALESLDEPEVVERVPEALLLVAKSYLRDLNRKNEDRLIRPLLNTHTKP